MRILEFFTESDNRLSLMRLITFVFAMDAVWASSYILLMDVKNYSGAIATFTSIAGTALAGKLLQKPMENKQNQQSI
jgi:hypothetical protein